MHANGASKNEENKNMIKIFSTANIIQVREKNLEEKVLMIQEESLICRYQFTSDLDKISK